MEDMQKRIDRGDMQLEKQETIEVGGMNSSIDCPLSISISESAI